MEKKKLLLFLLTTVLSITATMPSLAVSTSDVINIEVYGGDLSAKKYKEIEFSVENLGVSGMALGSIINPSGNTSTANKILERKRYYDNGNDSYWMNQEQATTVENFLTQWKKTYITNGMSDEEKFKTIYNYMVSTITYEDNARNNQSSYGALIDKRCVCNGYANGFLKMAKACGLDTKFLLSPSHAINMVEISGEWYATDVTQKYYKNAITTAIYYMHTIPENSPSIAEEVKKINERNIKKGDSLNEQNEKYKVCYEKAISENVQYHISDENIIPNMLDYLENNIETDTQKKQHLYIVLYTDGKNFTEFMRTKFNYNQKYDSINKIIASELKERPINGSTIKSNASCIVRFKLELGEDGMDTFGRLWIDENEQNYVILDCCVQLQ